MSGRCRRYKSRLGRQNVHLHSDPKLDILVIVNVRVDVRRMKRHLPMDNRRTTTLTRRSTMIAANATGPKGG